MLQILILLIISFNPHFLSFCCICIAFSCMFRMSEKALSNMMFVLTLVAFPAAHTFYSAMHNTLMSPIVAYMFASFPSHHIKYYILDYRQVSQSRDTIDKG